MVDLWTPLLILGDIMATTDSGGETGYESNDSSGSSSIAPVESPKSDAIPMSLNDKEEVPFIQFDYSESVVDEGPSATGQVAFFGMLPMGEHSHFGTFSHNDDHSGDGHLRCKIRSRSCALRRAMRFSYHSFPARIENIRNIIRERKFIMAANLNNVEAARSLLDMGVNPCAADKRQRTALHFAACKGYADMVRLLLERGANPNQKDAIGNTPLHLAACTNHVNVITLLLQTGANPQCMDNSGRSPLQLAQSKLKLLHSDRTCSSQELKQEVLQIIQMLHTYLQKSGLEAEAELLYSFSTRLTLSQSKEEADDNVRDLLSQLSNMSLKSSSDSV